MHKLVLGFVVILTTNISFSQKIKSEIVEYQYIQLPLEPVDKSITHYQSSIVADYIEDNRKKQAEYDAEVAKAQAEFDTEMAAYPAQVAAAEQKYERELEAYNEKTLAEKVVEKKILDENNKPVKRIPPEPRLRQVREPKLQREYDLPALASTYLTVDGFQNDPANAVKIDVILYGFDNTKPITVSEVKKQVSSSGGNTVTKNVTYYHTEFTYRHTMSVRATGPDGSELFFLTPQELNNYKKYETPASTSGQSINAELLIQTHEEKVLQENLLFIQGLVNDKIGYKHANRSVAISYVKENKGEYTDLLVAFNDASAGLKLLIDDEVAAKEKLGASIKTYEEAMFESNMDDKKARIDKNVSFAVFFNAIECYFAVGELEKAEAIITKLNALPINGTQRKLKEEYEFLINDTKKRINANN